MSYNVSLWDGERLCQVPPHEEGAIVQMGGCSDASMSVTYNYSRIFGRVFPHGGLRALDKQKAIDTIPWLEAAIGQLGNDPPDDDYWKPTDGNARHALEVMLIWALLHRHKGVWSVG